MQNNPSQRRRLPTVKPVAKTSVPRTESEPAKGAPAPSAAQAPEQVSLHVKSRGAKLTGKLRQEIETKAAISRLAKDSKKHP